MPHWEIAIFFFAIAFVYASVGFGGGSSYLALLSLYALPFQEMRLIALVCNVIVVTGGTIVFIRNGQVAWKKILPIVLVSVPLAYVGASLPISHSVFFILLGSSLVLAAILLWVKTQSTVQDNSHTYAHTVINSILGGAIGFLAGMVGIGGGIFLSPVLNIMNWDTAKRIAATASVFILVNSLAGIAGQLSKYACRYELYAHYYPWLCCIGRWFTGFKLRCNTVQPVGDKTGNGIIGIGCRYKCIAETFTLTNLQLWKLRCWHLA